MLSKSVAVADSINSSAVYAPWTYVETVSAGQILADLGACWDQVCLRRRTAKETSERWYHYGSPRSKTSLKTEVRI